MFDNADPAPQRIVIVGATGSGKSTIARTLSERYGIVHIDLDDLYWNPGWIAATDEEFRIRTDAATLSSKWIVTGNYRAVRDIVWNRADTLIWLDYSLARCLYQLIIRTFTRLWDRKTICNGNRETVRMVLSKRSIILWLFKTHTAHRQNYNDAFAKPQIYPNIKRYIRLKKPLPITNRVKTA